MIIIKISTETYGHVLLRKETTVSTRPHESERANGVLKSANASVLDLDVWHELREESLAATRSQTSHEEISSFQQQGKLDSQSLLQTKEKASDRNSVFQSGKSFFRT